MAEPAQAQAPAKRRPHGRGTPGSSYTAQSLSLRSADWRHTARSGHWRWVCTLQRSAYAGSKPNRKKHSVARHRHAASRFERIHVRSYTLEDQISSLRVRRGAPCAGLPPKIATKGGLKRFKFCKESDVLFCKVTPTLLRSGRGRCPEWSPRRRSRRCLWLGLA